MLHRLLLALVLLLPAPAAAQSLEGAWALRADGAIIFRYDIEPDGDGWTGTWSRPASFATDGDRFGNLTGPPERIEASEGKALGAWVELTFPDARPGAIPDVFRFNLLSKDRAEMIYAGTGLAPYTLERVADDAVLGPWEQGKVYYREGAVRPPPPPRPVKPAIAPPAEEEEERKPAFEGR